MATKKYQDWTPEQGYLLPPSPTEWLPNEHLVYFVVDVVQTLDLSAIENALQSKDARGTRPYAPRMMTALLLYAYCTGVFSSRKIERATYENVAFRVLAAGHHPHFTRINEFRRVHREALAGLFLQGLQLCQRAGLVKLGHVSLDGTKVQASASKHKAMSYERMQEKEKELVAEIEALFAQAAETDASEDAQHGAAQRGDELPEELRRRQSRLARIQAARAALAREAAAARAEILEERARTHRAQAAAAAEPAEGKRAMAQAQACEEKARAVRVRSDDDDDDAGSASSDGAAASSPPTEEETGEASMDAEEEASGPARMPAETPADAAPGVATAPGADLAAPSTDDSMSPLPGHRVRHMQDGTPHAKAQRNFTDPESRIMVKGKAFLQAYNAQAAVDAAHQIIVAEGVSNQAPDQEYLVPMLQRVVQNCGRPPEKLSADAGYFSHANVGACEQRGVDPYIATGREARRTPPAGSETPQNEVNEVTTPEQHTRQRMKAKLATEEGRAIYARRKCIPEPVFGQIKEAMGFRRFSLRGLDKVRCEWGLVCLCHNLRKLFAAGGFRPAAA